MKTDKPDLAFQLAGACFALGGLALVVAGVIDGLAHQGLSGNRDVVTIGSVTEVSDGDIQVRIHDQEGREVVFDGGGLLAPPWFETPYATDDDVTVAFAADQPAAAIITDRREWIRIGLLAAVGLAIAVWGWAISRYGLWGALGGVAAWLVLRPFGETAAAAILRQLGG